MDKPTKQHIQQILFDSLAHTGDSFGIFDPEDRLIYCNQSLAGMFGQSLTALNQQTFSQIIQYSYLYSVGPIINTDDINVWLSHANGKRRKDKFRNFEIDLQDGRWLLATEQLMPDGHIFFYATDITEKKSTEKKLEIASQELFQLATTDALTNIHNRRYFLELARIELSRAKRAMCSCALLMIDLDNFKILNDTYGHQGGDFALQHSANAMKEILRPYDILGRIGGEEFAILLPETNQQNALEVAERIRIQIENSRINFLTHTINLTASIGLSISEKSNCSLENMMSLADKNLYFAKNNGRNLVYV